MKKYIDLHVHSTISDGTFTPSELVHYALKKNLAAFALTDHDTTDGLEEAFSAALGSNLENSSENREYLKEIYESGNAIANHTYSHNFHKLYPSNNVNVNVFMKEIAETDKIMRNILGDNFNTRVLRMPGGYMSRVYYHDKNLNALKEALKETGVVSIDWDAETGDATGNGIAPNRLINTAIKESANKEHVVLLMHDAAAKKTTVEALPKLIEYYKNQGYAFKVISNPEQTNSEQTNSDQ